jgi:hypothetical protein
MFQAVMPWAIAADTVDNILVIAAQKMDYTLIINDLCE